VRRLVLVLLVALAPTLLSVFAPGAAHAQDRRLVHEPPAQLTASRAWECVLRVTRPEEWEELSLFYRKSGEEAYTLLAFREDRGAFRATVPGDAIAPPALEYHIVGRTTAGTLVSFPEETPREHPMRVSVIAPALAAEAAPPAEGILLLSPAAGEITDTATPDIAVLFDPPLAEASGATLFVDGADVTAASERTIDFLFFTPASPLAAGEHEATIVARADSVSAERRLSWRFHVLRGPEGGAPAARPAGEGFAYGRWEAGWAYANAEDDPDPFVLPYDETSDVTFYASFDAARGTTSLHADASRDPIYDDEVRASVRVDREALRAEAGDIYPYLSELSVAWQSGKGALAAYGGTRAGAALFGMRTLDAEIFEDFGTYSQFLYGAQASGRAGGARAALTLVFGHDREESIPDSTRFTTPQTNRVASFLAAYQFSPRIELGAEVAHASISLDDTETANAARVVARLGERGVNEIELEYHDYGRGYVSLGSPTIDSGERGVAIDGTTRLPARLRMTAEAEIYTDRDIFQPLEEGSKIVQATARLDREFARQSGATLSTYLFARYYHVPFESIPYENRYATLGFFAQSGRAAGSFSATRSITESAVFDTSLFVDDSTFTGGSVNGSARDWTLNGSASYSGLFDCVTPRLGLRWTHLNPALTADEDRWTANAEVSVTLWRTTLSGDYERIESRAEGGGDNDFVEHVLTTTIGRTF
jgi:hypothetical protein